MPISAAVRNKAWVRNRSPTGIAGSNPAGAWISVCCEYCVLSLSRADPSSRGVLLTVVRVTECDQAQQLPSTSALSWYKVSG